MFPAGHFALCRRVHVGVHFIAVNVPLKHIVSPVHLGSNVPDTPEPCVLICVLQAGRTGHIKAHEGYPVLSLVGPFCGVQGGYTAVIRSAYIRVPQAFDRPVAGRQCFVNVGVAVLTCDPLGGVTVAHHRLALPGRLEFCKIHACHGVVRHLLPLHCSHFAALCQSKSCT